MPDEGFAEDVVAFVVFRIGVVFLIPPVLFVERGAFRFVVFAVFVAGGLSVLIGLRIVDDPVDLLVQLLVGGLALLVFLEPALLPVDAGIVAALLAFVEGRVLVLQVVEVGPEAVVLALEPPLELVEQLLVRGLNLFEKTLMLGKIEGGRRRGHRG